MGCGSGGRFGPFFRYYIFPRQRRKVKSPEPRSAAWNPRRAGPGRGLASGTVDRAELAVLACFDWGRAGVAPGARPRYLAPRAGVAKWQTRRT